MSIHIISFTRKGTETSLEIKNKLETEESLFLYAKYDSFLPEEFGEVELVDKGLHEWTYDLMKKKEAIIFVGALGLAVRLIAEGIKDKLSDSAVLVVDELGKNVIPVLSGHVGGSNELAVKIAMAIGAYPVITTASDLENVFAIDMFAKERGLSIVNKDGIAKVTADALRDKCIRLSIEDFPPKDGDVVIASDSKYLHSGRLNLCPKEYAVGIGCRRGTDFEQLKEFYLRTLREQGIATMAVGAIGSIDLKEDEECLVKLSCEYNLPFITFSKDIMLQAKGSFEESEFVSQTTGVGNVCERAAMLLTENTGSIVLKKKCENGMTIAIARR